jgi:hypothetical protein
MAAEDSYARNDYILTGMLLFFALLLAATSLLQASLGGALIGV